MRKLRKSAALKKAEEAIKKLKVRLKKAEVKVKKELSKARKSKKTTKRTIKKLGGLKKKSSIKKGMQKESTKLSQKD